MVPCGPPGDAFASDVWNYQRCRLGQRGAFLAIVGETSTGIGCWGHTGETPRREPRRWGREMALSLRRFELASIDPAETGFFAFGADLAKQRGV